MSCLADTLNLCTGELRKSRAILQSSKFEPGIVLDPFIDPAGISGLT